MPYLIYSNNNPCGSVSKKWCFGPTDAIANWTNSKPDTSLLDINSAFHLLERIAKVHYSKGCKCSFEVQEL